MRPRLRFVLFSLLLTSAASQAQKMVADSTLGTLAGVITDAETGEPIPHLVVQWEYGDLDTRTDSVGYYELHGIPIGRHDIHFGSGLEGLYRAVRSVNLVAAERIRLDIRVQRSGRRVKAGRSAFLSTSCSVVDGDGPLGTGVLSGRVVETETEFPLVGANVFLPEIQKGEAADVNGCYAILDIPEGEHTVRISFAGMETQQVGAVQIRSGAPTRLNVTLEPGPPLPPVWCHYSIMAFTFREVYVARSLPGGGPYPWECGRIGIVDLPVNR
ncbi:MAG: carboxypeptidase-like regulatory domain-containing protein [Bacteroidota bacterium]